MNLAAVSKALKIHHLTVWRAARALDIDTKNIKPAQLVKIVAQLNKQGYKIPAASKPVAVRRPKAVPSVPTVKEVQSIRLVVDVREGVRLEVPISREQAKLVL